MYFVTELATMFGIFNLERLFYRYWVHILLVAISAYSIVSAKLRAAENAGNVAGRGDVRPTDKHPGAEIGDEDEDDGEDDANGGMEYIQEEDDELPHIPLHHERCSDEELIQRSADFYANMDKRRSVRMLSSDPVPKEVIEHIVRTAGTAPSGAHTQPWSFVAVSDADIKAKIRELVEAEEYVNYTRRMGEQWVSDLVPLRTTWAKPYLTEAPFIIMLFRKPFGYKKDGQKQTHYYNEISTGISAGFLLLAIQAAGLVTVTTTPMNCGPQLRALLGRPANEKLLLLFPVGFPAKDATIPDLKRKRLANILTMV